GIALPAHRWPVLWHVRAGAGTLFRLAGRRAPALAAHRQPDAPCDRGAPRLARPRLDGRAVACVSGAEPRARRLRRDQRGRGGGGRVVRSADLGSAAKENGNVTGKYLEDFAAGQIYRSGRLRVDEERIKTFAPQFDPQPFHLDGAAAPGPIFG